MLHPWIFKDEAFEEDLTKIESVEIGVFQHSGVSSVHLDLEDGGAPFDKLEKRTVSIHTQSFSPCNMHLTVDYHGFQIATFTTVVIYKERACIFKSLLPTNQQTEDKLIQIIKQS